jgi:translation initiation factor 2B subunit (eIF-2B alpha/beta/delta family)
MEGRSMAAGLAAAGVEVEFFSDAAIGETVLRETARTDAVVVGADAIAPGWFVNKCGSAMLLALATRAGVPCYVVATRDKFVDARIGEALHLEQREPSELWSDAPARIRVRNAYFERVPIDMVTACVTDVGLLAGSMIDEACRAAAAGVDSVMIDELIRKVERAGSPSRP